MRLSSSFIASAAVAALSTVLLYGPAASQTNAGGTLPDITVAAPKQAAPHVSKPTETRVTSHRATRIAHGPSSGAQTPSSTGRSASGARGPVMARIAGLEARASSCNGGCETSVRTGNAPWIGCSESSGDYANGQFSTTCRDTLSYKHYADCMETKTFLGWDLRRARWHCSGLDAGGKFEVADVNRSKHAH